MTDPNPASRILSQFAGQRIPGGCESCNAYQEVIEHEPNIFILRINHDDWCPEHPAEQNQN